MRTSTFLHTGLALTLAIALRAAPGRAQIRFDSPEHEKRVRRLMPVDDYPVADFDSAEPADLKERALRLARGKRHNNTNLSQPDVPRFVFQEGTGTISLGLPPSHAPIEPAFPIGQSDAIVIAEVEGARAYLSQDKTSVYSEFTVLIEEVLKNASALSVVPGNTVTTERAGGRVRLASVKKYCGASSGGRCRVRGGDTSSFSRATRRLKAFRLSRATSYVQGGSPRWMEVADSGRRWLYLSSPGMTATTV
jgi:hypothetical protein